MARAFTLLIMLSLCCMSNGDEFCANLDKIRGVYLFKDSIRMLVNDTLYEIPNADMAESGNGFHNKMANSRAWLNELAINGRAMPKGMQSQVPPNHEILWIGQRQGLVDGVETLLPIVQTTHKPKTIFFAGNSAGNMEMIVAENLQMYSNEHRIIGDYVFFHHTASNTPVVGSLLTIEGFYLYHLRRDNLFTDIQKEANANIYFWMVKEENKIGLLIDQQQAMASERLFKERLPLGYRIQGTNQLEIFNLDDRYVYGVKEMNEKAGSAANLLPTEGKVLQKFSIVRKKKFEHYFGCPLPTQPQTSAPVEVSTDSDSIIPGSSNPSISGGGGGGEPQKQGTKDWLYYAKFIGIPVICLLVVGAIAVYCCCTRGKMSQKWSRLSTRFAPRRGRKNKQNGSTGKNSKWASKTKGDSFASASQFVSTTNKSQSTGGRNGAFQSTASTSSAVTYKPSPRVYKPKKRPAAKKF